MSEITWENHWERYIELREFVRAACLELQMHRSRTDEQMDELFRRAYRLYSKHSLENAAPNPPDIPAPKELRDMLFNANGLLRSAHSIAAREGRKTNWDGFEKQLREELERELVILNKL